MYFLEVMGSEVPRINIEMKNVKRVPIDIGETGMVRLRAWKYTHTKVTEHLSKWYGNGAKLVLRLVFRNT